jgi:ubiquitin C-terminal hydrolase
MSLCKFDPDKMLKTCGLVNTGAICYLNSFLQSLMSCTSLTRFFIENEEKFIDENNKVALEYIKLIKAVSGSNTYSDIIDPSGVFLEVIIATKKKFPDKQFGRGQEDSGEGLHLFLDAIDSKELYKYFMYKYVVKTWCLTCVKQILETKDESCVLEIPPHFSGLDVNDDSEDVKEVDPLNAHIRQYISVLDDYTCPSCKLQKCCRIYQLAWVPEIITVMFSKFCKKSNMVFPSTLSFPATNDTTLEYKMVAKVEHSGGREGGHYWAHCYRDGEPEPCGEELEELKPKKRMYELNDRTVSQGTNKPTEESYIVFYHNA